MGGSEQIRLEAISVSPLAELNTDSKDDNPTLTADELLLCFTSRRPSSSGGYDIWCAERSSRDEEFGEPVELVEVNTDGFETSAALAHDGLALWFGAEVDDQIDIFVSTRADRNAAWGVPELVEELSSPSDDIPRPTAMGDRVMPLGSRRHSDSYWTYLAERPAPDQEFGEPVLIAELATEDRPVVDSFLSEDGLTLLYKSESGSDPGRLYFSTRPSLDEPFSERKRILGVDTDADERDPWLSEDGKRLYFSSDRNGQFDLFVAELE